MTSEHIPTIHLLIIKKALITLINRARHHFPRAGRARARPARVRNIDSLLLSLVENVDVIRTLELDLTIRSPESDLVGGHACDSAALHVGGLEAEEGLAHVGLEAGGHRAVAAEEGGADHGAG